MTKQQIIDMNVDDFINYIVNTYLEPVPERLETIEEMSTAGMLLAKYANSYTYLVALYAYLKAAARRAKRAQIEAKHTEDELAAKEIYEDLNDKANLTIEFYKAIKQQYAALSRMITVRSDNLDELHMSDSK